MAQIDIGKLSFTHKGNYDASTAYVLNDVVYYNGSAYVAKQSTTGNLPTSTAHWNLFVLKGTDTSVLTTQGDVLYHDGSSLARLAAGTSGQVLQTGGSGANPSWTTLSSDYVKLASVDTSGVSEVNFDNYFSADYHHYEFVGSCLVSNNDYRVDFNPRVSGSNILVNCYQGAIYGYEQNNDSNASISFDGRHNQSEGGRLSWGRTDTPVVFKVQAFEPQNSTDYKTFMYDAASHDSSYVYRRSGTVNFRNNTAAYTGMRFFSPNGANFTWKITMFGFRK